MQLIQDILAGLSIKGSASVYHLGEPEKWSTNLVLYSWQTIMAQLLTNPTAAYRLSGMYLEFENKDNPEDEVTLPTYDRTRSLTYYEGLSSHPTRDFLRVGLLGSNQETASNVTTLTFFASSSGSTGVHGKPFSSDTNSTIIGAALLALPSASDRTQDLLFSALYFAEGSQKLKLANSDIGLTWRLQIA